MSDEGGELPCMAWLVDDDGRIPDRRDDVQPSGQPSDGQPSDDRVAGRHPAGERLPSSPPQFG